MLPDIWDFSTISCQEEGEFGFYRWIRKRTLAQKAVIHLGQGVGTQGLCSDAQTQGAGLPQCSLPGVRFPSSDWGHSRWEQQGSKICGWRSAALPWGPAEALAHCSSTSGWMSKVSRRCPDRWAGSWGHSASDTASPGKDCTGFMFTNVSNCQLHQQLHYSLFHSQKALGQAQVFNYYSQSYTVINTDLSALSFI